MQFKKILGWGMIIISQLISYFGEVIVFTTRGEMAIYGIIFGIVIYLIGLLCFFGGSTFLEIRRKWTKRMFLGFILFGIFWAPFIPFAGLVAFSLLPLVLLISLFVDWKKTTKQFQKLENKN